MKEKEGNYLERIPIISPDIQYQVNEENHVIIIEVNKGIWNRLFQRMLKKPKITKIELDRYGSYVWEKINGENNIYEIGKEAGRNFGTEIEPLYERMAVFIRTLEMHGWIFLEKTVEMSKKS